jgi:hypothetical protein
MQICKNNSTSLRYIDNLYRLFLIKKQLIYSYYRNFIVFRKNNRVHSKNFLFLVLFFIIFFCSNAQNGFHFQEKNKGKQRVSFKLINNLIVIPIEVNGKNLSFILDTGVNKTIIFNVSKNDSIDLLNTKKILLRGLGDGEPVAAILSENNKMQLKDLLGSNETIYVILKDFFDLSSKMGTTIHGIIGYNLLRNFVVKINYKKRKIDFYNPDTYTYKKCKKCEVLPIEFYRKKPFVNVAVQLDTIGTKLIPVKMLVDSGGSDAIWIFENSKSDIKTPKIFYNDILGEGLSGAIFGKRSRIPRLVIGKFEIKKPTISFLDSLSTLNARKFKNRNGSLGGDILKRFKVWLDYPSKQIMLKKNNSFRDSYNYNMSGLDIVYSGKELIKEEYSKPSTFGYGKQGEVSNSISFITDFTYKFKSTYKIKGVVAGSVGDKVGLKAGDVILRINRKSAYTFKLSEIMSKLQERENKKIRIEIERDGETKVFSFRLEKRI